MDAAYSLAHCYSAYPVTLYAEMQSTTTSIPLPPALYTDIWISTNRRCYADTVSPPLHHDHLLCIRIYGYPLTADDMHVLTVMRTRYSLSIRYALPAAVLRCMHMWISPHSSSVAASIQCTSFISRYPLGRPKPYSLHYGWWDGVSIRIDDIYSSYSLSRWGEVS